MHQKQQHFHLVGREGERLSLTKELLLLARKVQIADCNIPIQGIRAALHFHTAKKRLYPHQKHRRTKRLGQIVVPALQNSADVVVFGVFCREQNDRDLVLCTNEAAAGQSVRAGHHYVKNNKIGASFKKRT